MIHFEKLLLLFSMMILLGTNEICADHYEVTVPADSPEIISGHLKLGGAGPDGAVIDVNSSYMSINGKPVIPVMGEFHYSRYPEEQWEEEVLKIKAGGISVIPTYVFWSIHEPFEGKFDWSGNRNLRKFIQLCAKHSMPVIVRIGPFCHGEIRNGGLPDWLFAKPVVVRSNDPSYLRYVRILYSEIARQIDGLYFKDGGPIIGIQIENEHQHSAAPWALKYDGERKDMTSADYDADITKIGVSVQEKEITTADLGDIHMKTLKDMAVGLGMDVPLYTATGWGNAAVIGNEAIPVTSAYTYPFWSKPAMSAFCMFKDIKSHPDYAPVRYDTSLYPSFAAEMGVGIQMIYSSRPVVEALAAEALMVRTLGSGSNGIGYYMYHGGSTPALPGGFGFYSDEPMGVPKISYDFQAPLGEFGLEHGSYRALNLIHHFLRDFGETLAPMSTVLPDGYEKMTPDNRDDLRFAVRTKDGAGFVFMVNFQDHDTGRHDQSGLSLKINLPTESISIPARGTFTLTKDESLILPFNMKLGGALLKYAMAQPLLKLNDTRTEHFIFFAPEGMKPEFLFDPATVSGRNAVSVEAGMNSTFTVKPRSGKAVKITVLTREQALDCFMVNGKLIMTDATVLPYDDYVELRKLGNPEFTYYTLSENGRKGFTDHTVTVEAVSPSVSYEKIGNKRVIVHMDGLETNDNVAEYFLKFDYTGDVCMAFLENRLVQDHFYYGKPWLIGLNRHSSKLGLNDFNFYIRPLTKSAPFLQYWEEKDIPDMTKGSVCRVNSVEVIPQYAIKM